jgi:S-adenosyl methyltransferase
VCILLVAVLHFVPDADAPAPPQVSELLDGFSLVEPGLVHVTDWRPDAPGHHGFDAFLAAVGLRAGEAGTTV